MEDPLRTKRVRSLSSAAYAAIKRDIVRGELAPDSQLTEAALARAYRLGRMPVREALGRLAQERLVRVIPRRGYLVAPIDIQDVQDLYQLRLLLEAEAARLAAGHVDAAQLRSLDAACRAGYDPADNGSVEAFLRLNTRFHVTVARTSGNARLAAVMEPLLDEMERLMHVGLRLRNRTSEMAHEHQDLVEALVKGDAEQAAHTAAAQVRSSQRMVLAALLRQPMPETAEAAIP